MVEDTALKLKWSNKIKEKNTFAVTRCHFRYLIVLYNKIAVSKKRFSCY